METTVSQPGAVALEPPSTVLNPETVKTTSGGGAPSLTQPGDGLDDVLTAELARMRADEKPEDASKTVEKDGDEPDAKPEKVEAKAKETDEKPAKSEEKPERPRSDDGKFAKAEKVENKDAKPAVQAEPKSAPDEAATGQDGSERGRQSEGRQHYEPPARFLPKEKEAWGNVPNVVKSAIDRVSREHDTELQQYRTSHEEWTKLDKFQQMAKQHNTSVADALERYTALDGLLQSNPIEAMRQILATRGITPEQYANHVLQNPQLHQAPPPRAQPDPVAPQIKSEVESLRNEIQNLRQEQAVASIIDPFRAGHPRFDELQEDIAFFLGSGKIPASLSPVERLEAAYDMAERINPTSMPAPAANDRVSAAADTARPVNPDAGKKSIRGAPAEGFDPKPDDADTDLDTFLRKQLRTMRA